MRHALPEVFESALRSADLEHEESDRYREDPSLNVSRRLVSQRLRIPPGFDAARASPFRLRRGPVLAISPTN